MDEALRLLEGAAQTGHVEEVRHLLNAGVNVNTADEQHQRRPLHYACVNGHIDTVRLLLDRGAELNVFDKHEWTPLHSAAYNGHEVVTQLLLVRGASVDARNNHGWTPLHCASWIGCDAVVGILLQWNAKVDAKNWYGETPLHSAVSNRQEATVVQLLSGGASVDAKTNNGWTPLLCACWRGCETMARILLDEGANVVGNDKDRNSSNTAVVPTPLQVAISNRHESVARLLLERGARANLADENEGTPLHWANDSGYYDMVQLLVKHDAKQNASDSYKRTPLMMSEEKENIQVVSSLEDAEKRIQDVSINDEHEDNGSDALQNENLPSGILTVFQAEPLAWESEHGSLHSLDWLDLDSERNTIKEALKGTNVDALFEPATPDLLGKFLAKGNGVLHLSCHGYSTYLSIEDGWGGLKQLVLENFISWVESGRKTLHFVFVSSCDSRNAGDALVAAGVPHVICCREERQMLSNAAAKIFARNLYRALALGNTLKVAFELGKQGVKHSNVMNAEAEIEKFVLLPEEGNHDVNIFISSFPGPKQRQKECLVRSGIPHVPHLVGRDKDIYRVLQKLLDSRLVRVTGAPGIGKGSLTMAVGHYLDKRKTWGDVFWLPVARDSTSTSLYSQLYAELLRRNQEVSLSLENRTGKECCDRVLDKLHERKALIAIDARKAEDRSLRELGSFLHELFQGTGQVKILVVHRQGNPVCSPIPSGYPCFETDVTLKPLDFRGTALLFGETCQHVTCSPNELPAKLEARQSPEMFKLLGEGVPAKVRIAAKNMTLEECHKLMDEDCKIKLTEFGRCHELQEDFVALHDVGKGVPRSVFVRSYLHIAEETSSAS